MIFAHSVSLVLTHRVIWLNDCGDMDAYSSLIWAMALRIDAQHSFTSLTVFGSSKMPHGTMQCPPRRRSTRWRVDSFWML